MPWDAVVELACLVVNLFAASGLVAKTLLAEACSLFTERTQRPSDLVLDGGSALHIKLGDMQGG